MDSFNSIWHDLARIMKDNNYVIFTLAKDKRNIISKVSEDGLLVTTKSNPKFIPIEWIADSWQVLNNNGEIVADDLPGRARHRSSFIMALLSKLPNVKVSLDPVKLSIIKNTHKSASWIFQGNPRKFDINRYISDQRYIWWSVRQEHFKPQIRIGDEVFLWRTESGGNGIGGIIARAIVIGPPIMRTDEESKEYWRSNDWSIKGLGVPLAIQEAKVNTGFLSRVSMLKHPNLSDMLILKMANQTNYKLEERHAMVLQTLWGVADIQYEEDEQEASTFPEGKRVFRIHQVIERNPHLIGAAKNHYKQRHGELICMACDFSFTDKYGEIGEDFIEGHHTTPLSEIDGEYGAKVEDIALVCSNCHRMLHRKRPWLSIGELKQLIMR